METLVGVLKEFRQPLADYQSQKGISKDAQISFIGLLTAICQYAYNAAVNIAMMLYHLLPLVDGLLFLLRFALDRSIDILETDNRTNQIIKIVTFVLELIAIIIIVVLIISIMLVPIINLIGHYFRKISNLFYNV